MTLLLVAGCAFRRQPPTTPPEVTDAGVASRVMISPGLNTSPAETVARPGDPSQGSSEPSPSNVPDAEPTTFALGDAIAFALRNSPRLRSARAAIERARGEERVAFAPFLPHVDVLAQSGVVSNPLGPGIPGYAGFLIPTTTGAHSYAQAAVALEWTLYDFGRTGGRHRQAVIRERIAELQRVRADQTVAFDVTSTYVDVLSGARLSQNPRGRHPPGRGDPG